MADLYRVGNHQPQNVYRGDQYIGVMFSPEDAAHVVACLNWVFGGLTLAAPDGPKMLRETLCVAATRIGNSDLDEERKDEHIARLGRLIAECDRHRPLGPDGKHGDRHTPTCGCEDVGPRDHTGGRP